MEIEDLHRFEDIHTHIKAGPTCICSLPPIDAIALSHTNENQPYSIELHPWHASSKLLEDFFKACEICKDDPRFIAIGECGLDKLHGVDMYIQKESFHNALIKAMELNKPVIIHCVKAWEEMIKTVLPTLKSPTLHSCIPIIHGFRKNPIFAEQLVSLGFCLSLGKRFDKRILDIIPSEKIFWESDQM